MPICTPKSQMPIITMTGKFMPPDIEHELSSHKALDMMADRNYLHIHG